MKIINICNLNNNLVNHKYNYIVKFYMNALLLLKVVNIYQYDTNNIFFK